MTPRVLVIGCGSIGQRHTGNLRALGVQEILVHDPEAARMETLQKQFGVSVCESLRSAYARQPQAALVCAPSSLHLGMVRDALRQGCDVFVEKPLAHTLDGVDEVLALARELDRLIMVGYNMRFNPLGLQIKAWLDAGLIGQAISARIHVGSYLPWRHPQEDYRRGYGAREELGGGVLLDAIHELDYALWFFGMPESVYCLSGKLSQLDITTEDIAELLWWYPHRTVVSIHLDYLQRPHQRWCEVIGTQGYLSMDFVQGRGRLIEGESRKETLFAPGTTPNDSYLDEMAHFLKCVAREAVPPADGAVGRASLVIASAAKRSVAQQQPVELAPYLSASVQRAMRTAPLRA